MSYVRLVRFILPLAVTAIVVELGSQVLNAGMARAPAATTTLAAYGLAWGLILFLTAPLVQAKELGLALVNDRTALVVVRRFVVLLGAVLMVGLASLTLTPLGNLVIERLHAIDAGLGAVVRTALFWLIPYPLLKGYALFHAGLLLRVRHTERVSYATLSNLGVSIVAAFGLIFMPWIQTRPILLPILVTYLGILTELTVLLTGVAQHGAPVTARPRPANAPPMAADRPAQTPITLGRVVRFFWPLALIMLVQEVSRPVINLFVARGPDATNALAILAVLYTLGRIPYGWLNEIRNLAPAFRDEADSRPAIRRFAVACGLVSMTMMGVLFWTPLRDVILQQWIGVPPHLAALAVTPLHLFTLFSISVTLRGYYHGIGLAEGRTRAMAPSAPARLVAIVSTLVGLPWLGVTGATLGVAALLAGFTAEAIVVWWGVRGRAWLRRRRQAGTPAHA